jgi:dTDP-4-dehydrorhamnose reductase
MYGVPLEGRRDNPITWWVKSWKQEKITQVVNDTITQPLFVDDCAKVCWSSLEYSNEVFNVAGPNKCSLYEFAKTALKQYQFPENLLQSVSSDTFKNIAPRPKDTSFDIQKIITKLNIIPTSIEDGLNSIKPFLF